MLRKTSILALKQYNFCIRALLPPVKTKKRFFCKILNNRQQTTDCVQSFRISSRLVTHGAIRTFADHITSKKRIHVALQAALTAFTNPERDDAVAVLGELTGETALREILNRMKQDKCGSRIIRERWHISEDSLNPDKLRSLKNGSFGRCYANFLDRHGFSPNERKSVKHIADPDLAYVMQRYRQVHDFWHVLCGIQPTVIGEVAIKWFEMVQTGLPIATMSAFVGPFRLPPSEIYKLWTSYVPWASRCGSEAVFLMNVPYEEYLEKDIHEVRNLLQVTPYDGDEYLSLDSQDS